MTYRCKRILPLSTIFILCDGNRDKAIVKMTLFHPTLRIYYVCNIFLKYLRVFINLIISGKIMKAIFILGTVARLICNSNPQLAQIIGEPMFFDQLINYQLINFRCVMSFQNCEISLSFSIVSVCMPKYS